MKMAVLGGKFQDEKDKYMVAEVMEEYAIENAAAAYKYLGDKALVGNMPLFREIKISIYSSTDGPETSIKFQSNILR